MNVRNSQRYSKLGMQNANNPFAADFPRARRGQHDADVKGHARWQGWAMVSRALVKLLKWSVRTYHQQKRGRKSFST